MDLRARSCTGKIKIGVMEAYSNGKEDAIRPFDMPSHEKESWNNHAENVIAIIKYYVPNAEIHLVRSTTQGMKYLIDNDIKLVNISLAGYSTFMHRELSNHAFLIISAGNDGSDGESGFAQIDKACAVGAVNSLLQPQSYSSYGKGAVKTCAITGINTYTGKALHGTSFASPVVTGLLAQWYVWFHQMFGLYPSIKHTNRFIIENSHDIFEDSWDFRTGYGLFRLPKVFKHKALELVSEFSTAVIKTISETGVTMAHTDLVLTPFIKDGRFVTSTRDIGDFADMTVDWKHDIRTGVFID